MKEDKTSEKELKSEISNLPVKEIKVIVINMLIKLKKKWMNSVRTSANGQQI